MLPPRIPKREKRTERWKSQAHLKFVRSHACSVCGSMVNVEAAHVRLGSNAGIGRKPDDHRAVSLCGGLDGCHQRQHTIGERTFWDSYAKASGQTVDQLIDALCRESPKRREIAEVRNV